ncbi:MAG: hypothetical protein AB7S77_16440 [Desulfatirhabdiaceae bacterium]
MVDRFFKYAEETVMSGIVQNPVSKPMAHWEWFFNRYFQLSGMYDFYIEIKGKRMKDEGGRMKRHRVLTAIGQIQTAYTTKLP